MGMEGTTDVTCPGCGQQYTIRKAGMEEMIALGELAVPSWFREADPATRMLNLQARQGPDTRPEPIRWDEGLHSAEIFRGQMGVVREVVVSKRILKPGEVVTDPTTEMAAHECHMCCCFHIVAELGDLAAEETKRLATFRQERRSDRLGSDSAAVRAEAE